MGKNWKTTLAGLLVAAPSLLTTLGVFEPGNKYANLIAAAGAIFLGFVAKDKNVTGGTVAQTTTVRPTVVSE